MTPPQHTVKMAGQDPRTAEHPREPRLFNPPGGGPEKPKSDFTREELLWLLRTNMEGNHRCHLYYSEVMRVFEPPVQKAIDNLNSDMSTPWWDSEENCNKTVPIYFLPSCAHAVVVNIFENYIYRRWFRPYRTDISTNQFPCKFIMPEGLDTTHNTPPPEATVSTLTTFHGILCARTEQLLQVLNDRTKSKRGTKRREKKINKKKKRNSDWDDNKNTRPAVVICHKGYALQSLYKALIAIASCADYDGEDSTTAGRFPVYLVRTGVEDGLSAPVSFDAELASRRMKYVAENVVETKLEAALDFIMALEARETAFFDVQPEPASVVEPPRDKKGRKLTNLPSTQWVSDEKAAEWGWCGRGLWWDGWRGKHEQMELEDYKDLQVESEMLKEGKRAPIVTTYYLSEGGGVFRRAIEY
jgi:hypothetical protein